MQRVLSACHSLDDGWIRHPPANDESQTDRERKNYREDFDHLGSTSLIETTGGG